jgi:hypothetical protein
VMTMSLRRPGMASCASARLVGVVPVAISPTTRPPQTAALRAGEAGDDGVTHEKSRHFPNRRK